MTGMSHEELVLKAEKIAVGLGYTHIRKEYTLQINNYSFRLDVYATNDEGKQFGAECGNINGDIKIRMAAMNVFLDDFFWLPYATTKLVEVSNTMEETRKIIESLKQERLYWLKEKQDMEDEYKEFKKQYNDTVKLVHEKSKLEESIKNLEYKEDKINSHLKCIAEILGKDKIWDADHTISKELQNIYNYTKCIDKNMVDIDRAAEKIEIYAMRIEDLLIERKKELLTKSCIEEIKTVITKHIESSSKLLADKIPAIKEG